MNINKDIRSKTVLLIDESGKNLGSFKLNDAIKMSENISLDLVEVSKNNNGISVCKMMNYSKWKYEQSKKSKKKTTKKVSQKEIRFRPNTGDNDLKHKAKQVSQFINNGNKVKLSIIFRGREIEHMYNIGSVLVERFLGFLSINIKTLSKPKLEGRSITFIIGPDNDSNN
jgi:translation initiation factor IF-3